MKMFAEFLPPTFDDIGDQMRMQTPMRAALSVPAGMRPKRQLGKIKGRNRGRPSKQVWTRMNEKMISDFGSVYTDRQSERLPIATTSKESGMQLATPMLAHQAIGQPAHRAP